MRFSMVLKTIRRDSFVTNRSMSHCGMLLQILHSVLPPSHLFGLKSQVSSLKSHLITRVEYYPRCNLDSLGAEPEPSYGFKNLP